MMARRAANLVTAKEASDIKQRLGLEGVNRRRGFGFDPPSDAANPSCSDEERKKDADKIFIAECVKAYRRGTLSGTYPMPNSVLVKNIRRAGGNIKWLAADLSRRRTFHYEYCRALGRAVPYEDVWQDSRATVVTDA
jgi:hypothetical protein